MRLYLDDLRQPPHHDANGDPIRWDFHCTNTSEAIQLLRTGEITFISFDYDLGPEDASGNTVAMWIEDEAQQNPDFKVPAFEVHSNDRVGRKLIEETMLSALRHQSKVPVHEMSP